MSTDWDAASVAKVVSERMAKLGVKQKALAERAGLSPATLRAIQHSYKKHRPTADTLERLSTGLGFAPGYLQAVAEGRQQPAADDVSRDPQPTESGDAESKFTLEMLAGHLSKLDAIEKNLNNVITAVREIDRKLDRIAPDVHHQVRDS